jgi:hypothetical protein
VVHYHLFFVLPVLCQTNVAFAVIMTLSCVGMPLISLWFYTKRATDDYKTAKTFKRLVRRPSSKTEKKEN